MRTLYILIMSLFLCITSYAQNLDSLKTVAATYKATYGETDHRYLDALNKVVRRANEQEEFDVAYTFRKEYYEIVKSKYGTESPEYADACMRMGTVTYRSVGLEEGLKFYLESIALHEKLALYNDNYFTILSIMCQMYEQKGDYESAHATRNKLITLLEPKADDYAAHLLSAYAATYPYLINVGKYEQQILYMDKAQALIRKYNLAEDFPDLTALVFGTPRLCYNQIGKYNKAIEAGKSSQAFFAGVYGEDCLHVAQYYVMIGIDYLFAKNYKTSLEYFIKGIERLENIYNAAGVAISSDQTYLPALTLAAGIYEKYDDLNNANLCRKKADETFRASGDTASEDYCDNLHTLYLNYSMTGQFSAMTQRYHELEPLALKYYGEDSDEYFRFITGSFDAFLMTNQKDIALEVCDKVNALKNSPRAVGLFTKASVYMQFKDGEKSIPLLEECLAELHASKNSQEKALLPMCYNSLGYIYMDYDLQKAELYLQKAVEYSKIYSKADPGALVEPTMNLGMIHYRSGKYKNALEYFIKARDIAFKDKNEYQVTTCLNNIGLAYIMLGDYANAISILEQAKDMAAQYAGTNSVVYAMTLQNLSVYYGNLYEYDKCIEITSTVLGIFESIYGMNSKEYGAAIHNMGIFNMYKNDYQTAALCYMESIKIHEALPDDNRQFISMSYGSLGQALCHLGKMEEGQAAYTKSANILDELGLSESLDAVQLLDMYAYSLLEKLDSRSADFFMNAIVTAEKIGVDNHPVAFHAKMNYGMASLLKDGPFDGYVDLMVSSLKDQYQNNFGLYNESEREQFWSKYMHLHDILFSCRNSDRDNGSLYDYLLTTKGMLLNTSISLSKLIESSNDESLIGDFNGLTEIRKQIASLEQIPHQVNSNVIDSLRNEANKIERRLISGSKEYGTYTSGLTVSWESILSKLKKNETAIEFVEYTDYRSNKDKYSALVLKKGWKYPKFIEICDREVIDSLLNAKSEDDYAVRINSLYAESGLYNAVWKSLEGELALGDIVYFSPSGALHNLSIESVQDYDGICISDKYDLRRVSSTRDIALGKNDHNFRGYNSATLYGGIHYDVDVEKMRLNSQTYDYTATRSMQLERGDTTRSDLVYLRGTEEEIRKVSQLLQDGNITCTLLKGEMANEESFKNLSAENCNILHVATHGFYLPTDKAEKSDFLKSMPIFAPNANGIIQFDPIATSMLRSGLAFAGGNKAWKGEQVPEGIDDGIATSSEISNMNLSNTDLIVLSACETGLGEVNDEGVFGLQRAFKNAGVNTIIMSLWKVNDHITQMMMTSFYAHLLSGKTKRDSFRLAQQEISAEYPNPYQWAAFIMLD